MLVCNPNNKSFCSSEKVNYSDRKLIVVVPDTVKEIEIQALDAISNLNKSYNAQKSWSLLSKNILESLIKKMIIDISIEKTIAGITKLRKNGFTINLVSESESNEMTFPVGHPQRRTLYVGHPAKIATYYPLADFHRITFESKFAEAIKLLISLGAKKLHLYAKEGYEKNSLFSLSGIEIPISTTTEDGQTVSIKPRFDFNKKEKEQKQLKFSAELSPMNEPKIPDDLFWYTYEPMWNTIAEGRLTSNLKNFVLEVNYTMDFDITSSLKDLSEKAGLSIGGKFTEFKFTRWEIRGEFKID